MGNKKKKNNKASKKPDLRQFCKKCNQFRNGKFCFECGSSLEEKKGQENLLSTKKDKLSNKNHTESKEDGFSGSGDKLNKEDVSIDLPASNAVESKVNNSVVSSSYNGPDENLQYDVNLELVKEENINTSSAGINDEPNNGVSTPEAILNKEVVSIDLPASNAVESKVDSSVESSGCKGPDENLQDDVNSELVKEENINTSSAGIMDEPYDSVSVQDGKLNGENVIHGIISESKSIESKVINNSTENNAFKDNAILRDGNCQENVKSESDKEKDIDYFFSSDITEADIRDPNQASSPVDDSTNCALNKSSSSLACNENKIVRCFGDGNKEQLAQPNLTFGAVNLKNIESSGIISTSNSNAVGEHKNDNKACMTILEVSNAVHQVRSTIQVTCTNGNHPVSTYADVARNANPNAFDPQKKEGQSYQDRAHKSIGSSNIKVKFFIVLPKLVKYLFIAFEPESLGGWCRYGVMMKPVDEHSSGVIYEGVLAFPKNLVNKPVEYKYFIWEEKQIWEFLRFVKDSAYNTNRVLIVKSDVIDILDPGIIFYQVDDFFMTLEGNDNFGINAWVNYFKKKLHIINDDQNLIFQQIFTLYSGLCNKPIFDCLINKAMFIRGLYSGFYDACTKHEGSQSKWIKMKTQLPLQNLLSNLEKQLKQNTCHGIESIVSCISLLLIFYNNKDLLNQTQTSFICCVFKKISLEDTDLTCDDLLKYFAVYFSNNYLRKIETTLQSLLQYWFTKSDTIPDTMVHVWCYALVIIHFISEEKGSKKLKLKNFDESNCGLPAYIRGQEKKALLIKTFNNLHKIKHSLQKDRLLQRSLAYLMEAQDFYCALRSGYFNERLLINMITFQIKSQQNTIMLNHYQTFLTELMKNDSQRECNRCHLVEALFNMLLASLQKIKFIESSYSYFFTIFKCISHFYKSIDLNNEEFVKALHIKISKILATIKSLLQDNFLTSNCLWDELGNIVTQLKFFEVLLGFQIDGKNEFQESALNILQKKIKQTDKMILLQVYCELDKMSSREEIKSLFEAEFSFTIENLLIKDENFNSQWMPSALSSSSCINLLIVFFIKKWKSLNGTDEKANFCLNWKHFKVFIELLEKHNSNEETLLIFNEYISMLQHVCNEVTNGNVTFSVFSNMIEKKSTLFELIKVLDCDFCQNFYHSFVVREEQAIVFNRARNAVNYTLQMFKQLLPKTDINAAMLEEKLKIELADLYLKEIFGEEIKMENYNNQKILELEKSELVPAEGELYEVEMDSNEVSYENESNEYRFRSMRFRSDEHISNEVQSDKSQFDKDQSDKDQADENQSEEDWSVEDQADEDASIEEVHNSEKTFNEVIFVNEETSFKGVSEENKSNEHRFKSMRFRPRLYRYRRFRSDEHVSNEVQSDEDQSDEDQADEDQSDEGQADEDASIEEVNIKEPFDEKLFSKAGESSQNEEFTLMICEFFSVTSSWIMGALRMMDFNFMSSFLFHKELQVSVKCLHNTKFDLHSDDLMKLIISPTIRKLRLLICSILSCKIHPSELYTVFSDYNIQECTQEVKLLLGFLNLNFTTKELENCMIKIKTVFLMQKYSEIATSAMEVKEKLNLKGDFSALQVIMQPLEKFKELQDVDSVENYENLFFGLTPAIHKIFKSISSCMHFFTWLKDNLKDPKEVKVFVEIMSIAAGETDYEVDRVKCFEACCLTFSHIIFELSDKSGFKELLQTCQQIEIAMKSDSAIIDKLTDTNRNLEWFKNAKKSQSSVATKTIMEAQTANRYGCFTIGNQTTTHVDFNETKLADVIKFEIRNPESAIKEYTLEEINDLQSRLMLLGGDIGGIPLEEKQREKDYLIEIVEVVLQLGHVYLMLCEAGDVSFINWKKTFSCNIESSKENLLGVLASESDKVEKRLAEWDDMLKSLRNTDPVINHFTIRQCLFLQRHLFLLSQDSKYITKLPPQFYTLLKFFDQNISLSNIKNALSMSRSFINKNESTKDDWKKVKSQSNFDELTAGEIEKLVISMQEDFDISESVAWAAIIFCFPYREGKAVLWCKNQNPDDEHIIELEHDARKKYEWLLKMSSCSEVKEEPSQICHNEAYISLTELGSFFKEYKEIINFRQVQRNIPQYINTDKPSLILLSHDDILYAVLEIYLYHNGTFPSSEEVLLCDKSVSFEEIEQLILRAFHNKDGLYCLVIDDCLQYEICEKTYNFLQKTMKLGKMSPILVFCSLENQNNSYLVTALDHYKLKMPSCIYKDVICENLLKRLQQKLVDEGAGIHLNGLIYKALVVKSEKSGMGKSFFIEKCGAQLSTYLELHYQKPMGLSEKKTSIVTIPVHGTTVDVKSIVEALLEFDEVPNAKFPRLYHFDVNPMVREGLDSFLFNLVVLSSLKTSSGKLWRMNDNDTCIIEITTNYSEEQFSNNTINEGYPESSYGVVVSMLPFVLCISPREAFQLLSDQGTLNKGLLKNIWFDSDEFKKSSTQRVCQYLKIYDGMLVNRQLYVNPLLSTRCNFFSKSRNLNSSHTYNQSCIESLSLDTFVYSSSQPLMDQIDCLRILLKYCGVNDPCWSELRNFVHFFNTQLIDCENCVFTSALCSNDLRGFKHFVVSFLLEMTQDFSTRSLSSDVLIDNHFMIQLKRQWEHSSHPYLFFNQDRATMTFFGFNVDITGNLCDADTQQIIKENIMSTDLYRDISLQMPGCLNTNYKNLNRIEMLKILCCVMGVKTFDPDPTYELTVDNIKKILAIHMRLRCIIPVIMMGETGCGKTKLIKFMCALRAGGSRIRNMLLVKVHGGVTHQDILMRINQAKSLAKENYNNYKLNTILFFDEANTSDAIGLIKEIMVDKRADGKPLGLAESGLEIIAACNPYKKHSKKMIQKLESAGLGYHVKSAYERIGDIPLRQLVYRVHPLPKSMIPLIWDFGQLDADCEKSYASQIIKRYIQDGDLPNYPPFFDLVVNVLAASQKYMRKQKDECSFVSLRDVERALISTSWFYTKIEFLLENLNGSSNLIMLESEKMRLSLVYALSICYIAKLEDRNSYRKFIFDYFTPPFSLDSPNQIKEEVDRLQKSFLNGIELEGNIAQNEALCENIFMMVICIELRIPLFVVGKPGSSKSLAKSIVQDCMQGNMSKSFLFKKFKQIFMLSYQCSPLSTAERIINTFRQCSRFQEGKDLNTFASVVVLDEVGLAEDSPQMPLKALHSLLEDGTDGSEDLTVDGSVLKNKRVAFIGISNWSLDPAKMNRGIMLYRGQPGADELVRTARDICSGDRVVCGKIAMLFKPLTDGYLAVYEEQKNCNVLKKCKKEEFFGLRDFYSLIKLVFCYARKFQDIPSMTDIKYAVKRNFSGLQEVDTWKIFKSYLLHTISKAKNAIFDMSLLKMITDSVADQCPCYDRRGEVTKRHCLSSRYLLLMTEDFAALPIIEQLYEKEKYRSCVIFGSSFPKDQQFTQVCRDINRIKICMETGTRVVLLNMENLYESLYDALNQYYVSLGGKNYVDLGIGTHRVKCRVHEDFRLIVVSDKANVYNTFPIPLINRLEKHFLTLSNGMTPDKIEMVEKLRKWANDFSCVKSTTYEFKPSDSFIGYTEDTCASIILKLSQMYSDPEEIFEEGCKLLLKLATPDSLFRVKETPLRDKFDYIQHIFFEQFHYSLITFLQTELGDEDSKFMQVTTFSRLLSPCHKESLTSHLATFKIVMVSLMQFETEQVFREFLRVSCSNANSSEKNLIIIQANNAQEKSKLIACAQYICKEAREQFKVKKISVLFILQLNYQTKHINLLSSLSFWECSHLDELCSPTLPSFIEYTGKSLHEIFCCSNGDAKSKLIELIVGSIQMAIRQLSERKKMSVDEVSERIVKLTELLRNNPEENSFVTTIMQMIQINLEEDESKMLPDYVNNWVQHVAIEQKYLQAYGTFRQALCYYVEDRIVPILTSIISSIDNFSNLAILCQQPDYTDLWINLFARVNISNLPTYNDFEESFQCKFPFSNRLCKEIELAMKNLIQPDETLEKHDYKLIYDALSSLPMTSLVIRRLSKFQIEDYIYDLVHLLFPNQIESSYKILAFGLISFVRSVTAARNKFFKSLKSTALDALDKYNDCDIAAIHIVLNTKVTLERIETMALILRNNPEISDKISIKETAPIDIDILVLDKLLSVITSNWLCPIGMEKIRNLNVLMQRVFDSTLNNNNFCSQTIRKINYLRIQWCRLRICERFSEFVFLPSSCFCFHQRNILQLLWKNLELLEDDMLTEESWTIVENFLTKIKTVQLSLDFSDDCMTCIYDAKELSFLLPCCRKSFHFCIHLILTETTECPNCKTVFEDEYIFRESLQKRHMALEKEEFKKQCDAFYAEIVAEYYFARKNCNPLKLGVIKKILDFVFSVHSTSNSFEDEDVAFGVLVDSTPIVCSFLLQKLIEKSHSEVESYLEKHILRLLGYENQTQLLDAARLFVYCFEDKMQSELSVLKKDTVFKSTILEHVSEELVGLYSLMEKFKTDASITNVTSLKTIASVRLYLTYSAEILYAWSLSKENIDRDLKSTLNEFFAALSKFLLKHKGSPAHIYFLKQIVRNHGINSLKKIIIQADIDWLLVEEDSSNIESYDKLLLYGENYKNICNRLVTYVLEEDECGLSQLEEDTKESNSLSILWLAILKGFHNLPEKVTNRLQHRYIQKCLSVVNKFSIIERFSDILYHLWIAVHSGKSATLLFKLLATCPFQVNGWFLPAMPSDDFAEVFNLMRINTNAFYTCPQGHPYMITECGRPSQVSACSVCKLPIGGQNHQLINGNKALSNSYDNTRSGHCLGSPSERNAFAIPQRNLTPASTTVQNLLIDLSLLAAALMGHEKDVSKLVYPHTEPNQILAFLLQHLEKDFSLLSNIIAKNDDETNTAVHLLIKRLLESDKQEYQHLVLKDQASRKQFENAFDRTVVQPFFSTLDEQLALFNKNLLTDHCINDSPLMRQIYELDEPPINEHSSVTVMSPQLWFYRQSVSVESLKVAVQLKKAAGDAKDISILAMFLEQETVLNMIKDLPSIIELQKFLQHEFNYKLDKQTAVDKTVKQLLSEFPKEIKSSMEKLFTCFIKSWNQARGLFTVRQKSLNPRLPSVKLSFNSELAYFISSSSDHGLCAAMLIDFLAFKQNEILEECQLINGSQVAQRVPILKLKENIIISYERERDLLPLVYLHCEYRLGIGRSPKIEYNLDTIQRRFFEKVIFGKAIIDIEVIQFLYRDGVKSLNFPLLRSSVKQTEIPFPEQQKMLEEINDTANISIALRAVETAVGILASTGGDPNMFYKKYLTDILRMNEHEYLASEKMQTSVRLTHLHSVWLMLARERARRIFTSKQQVPFPINKCFMNEEIEEKVLENQKKNLRHVDTNELLSFITEYIVLELPLRNESDSSMLLIEALQVYTSRAVDQINEKFQLQHIYLFWKTLVSL